MRRARKPVPPEMWSMVADPKTGKYLIKENSISYYMELEHTRLLRNYYRRNSFNEPTIEKWYSDLDRFTRKEIVVEGMKKKSENDFYPDSEFE